MKSSGNGSFGGTLHHKTTLSMARTSNWSDDYWPLLLQLFLRKPVGKKPLYSRGMIDLAMELHVDPTVLAAKMDDIARARSPHMESMVAAYADNPRRLARAIRLLRGMKGFNNADEFYHGVDTNETFEKDFRPIAEDSTLTPVMLTLVLDLYFRLTPLTMSAQTPEVVELSKLMKVPADSVVAVLEAYQGCDPCLKNRHLPGGALGEACRQAWQRFALKEQDELAAMAESLKEYFR